MIRLIPQFLAAGVCAVAALSGLAKSSQAAPVLDPSQQFFEARVRPLLVDHCLNCHGAAKQKGGLRLDSLAGLQKGGKHGLAVVPGKPESSRLISAISYHDPDLQMPPEDRLSDDQVRVLSEWVKLGTPWPAGDASIAAVSRSKHRVIVPGDKDFWSFRPVADPPVPAVKDENWSRNAVDRFILARLEAEGLTPAPQAPREELIRRATYDLTGLPPTPAEVAAFVNDPSSVAYENLIDRLLASPRYGERWGRHWLDVVRYAESDGFKSDSYRPNAWPYRDYVIKSFNDDKPYDRFVMEQLAGDEIAPNDPSVVVATGYLRAGLYEYNQRDVPKQWSQMLTEVTDVTADAFLGLSMGCARCHDHKFDPILQTDYYRLQAFFAPMLPRNDLPMVSADEKRAYDAAFEKWEQKTAAIRARMEPMEKKAIAEASRGSIRKFPEEMQAILAKSAAQRTPLEEQLYQLAMRQVYDPNENPQLKFSGAEKTQYDALKKQLAGFDAIRPKPLFRGLLMTDVGPSAPPTYAPGDPRHPLEPGFPVVLDGLPITAPPIKPTATSTGRRTALAQWIVQPENPLTARVMVNRIWQYHFGRGLVATSGDFGHLGTPPSHPELLDYLATRFMEPTTSPTGQPTRWSMKRIHRLIMTSAVYRQSSLRPTPPAAKMKDPENRWLWRMNMNRLEAEEVRDAMLATSGELQLTPGGESVDASAPRRSIYLKGLRNHHDAILEAFDTPDSFGSVPTRNQTTTSTQALLLLNGDAPLKRAAAFAARVRAETKSADPGAWVDEIYRLAYSRSPGEDERKAAVEFLGAKDGAEGKLVDLCHVVLNSSEFLYVP